MAITIDRAIENLERGRKDAGMIPEDEYTPTLDLATEAMKEIRKEREQGIVSPNDLLPGETKK
ncbi:MAG: hypothetical protein KAT75_07305 [Dehalococcoidia bacterium]|nr:hypothetical protein [Dehalococcoidia bacterium]